MKQFNHTKYGKCHVGILAGNSQEFYQCCSKLGLKPRDCIHIQTHYNLVGHQHLHVILYGTYYQTYDVLAREIACNPRISSVLAKERNFVRIRKALS